MRAPVVFLASGTRGDVLPYIALAQGLLARGIPTMVATHEPFLTDVYDAGVPGEPIGPNPTDLLHQPGAMPLTFNGRPIQSVHASIAYMQAARPVFRAMLEQAWKVTQGAGAVVFGLPTLWGMSIAEALGVPGVCAPLQPLTRTTAFPSALQPFSGSLGKGYNWLTHLVTEQALWQGWRVEINGWRRSLGLLPLGFSGPYSAWYKAETPFIYGVSPLVVPKPEDWPAYHVLAGYWPPPAQRNWEPPADLEEFLSDGDAPVYIGFGSMRQTESTFGLVVEAVRQAEIRAVVGLGAQAGQVSRSPGLFPLAEAPHAWLFPRMQAAVHHGGAGTTAASLRAGLPTGIVPVGVDQFFWGGRVAALGVGPAPLPQRVLSIERLSEMLVTLVEDGGMKQRAVELGETLRREDGVEEAAARIAALI